MNVPTADRLAMKCAKDFIEMADKNDAPETEGEVLKLIAKQASLSLAIPEMLAVVEAATTIKTWEKRWPITKHYSISEKAQCEKEMNAAHELIISPLTALEAKWKEGKE